MLRQLMFLLPIKFQRGKKLRTRRYRGLQSKEKRKLSLLTTTFCDEVVGGIAINTGWFSGCWIDFITPCLLC
ncbi:hypothetical protein B7L60_14405 [Escherichia coli]|nr:hypothetical protein AVR75_18290 [Escherichia coli]AMX31064.1 hypothetical protein A4R39_12630 [Escherichia coli]AMX34404.1 hypothetical protein A4R38_04265 [Escherichia coli]ANK50617.1 hypothetical protein WM90_01725 [Escherichia coli]EEV5880989.1 hypothetical protein [Escherichia coli]